MQKIYIAGADVFLPNAMEVLNTKKETCKRYGYEGMTPFDLDGDNSSVIYQNNISLIQKADIVVANLNDFRGDCIDDGTAFEIGYATALGKKVYGYRSDLTNMITRLGDKDKDGNTVENFGNCVNLMLAESVVVCEGTFEDAVKNIQ